MKGLLCPNLEVIRVDVENNLLLVKGGVPRDIERNLIVRTNQEIKRKTCLVKVLNMSGDKVGKFTLSEDIFCRDK